MPNSRNSREHSLDKARSIVAAMEFWNRFKRPERESFHACVDQNQRAYQSLGILNRLPFVVEDSSTSYLLKISLDESRPKVWRRVTVPGCSLEVLHHIIQIVMGWNDLHLHEFVVRKIKVPSLDDGLATNERSITLPRLYARNIKSFHYTYDFNEQLKTTIQIEDVQSSADSDQLPKCWGGQRAAPFEDSGGVKNWDRIREALRNPLLLRDDEIRILIDRLCIDFSSFDFDLSDINRELRHAFNRRGELRHL